MASLATAAARTSRSSNAPPPPSRSTPTSPDAPEDEPTPEELQAKRERRAHKRTKAMRELVETEKTYVKLLGKLIEHYVRPLSDFRLITEEQHHTLFPQIELINGLNFKFNEDLGGRMDSWDVTTTKIGELFIEFTPFFRMYQNYCNNHERAVGLMRKLMNKKNFVDYGKAQRKDCDGLDLSSMLILPIQRIPRYRMLLSEILKNTEEEHPDFSDLTKALATVEEVNGQINERMKEFERREQVKAIERKFTQQVNLLGPARQFVRSGKLKKVCRNKDRLYEFFLFSDLLIYASSYGGRLNLHNQLSINGAFNIEDVSDDGKYAKYEGRCFKIVSSTKSFVVYADTINEKDQWYDSISTVIEDRRNRSHLDQEAVEAAPVWIPDESAAECQMEDCHNKFSFFNRRHHCRRCGLLVCSTCSKYKLPNQDGVEQRACKKCFREVSGQDDASDMPEDEDDSSEDDNDAYIDALEQVPFYHDSLTAQQGENVLRQWGNGTGSYLVVPTAEDGSEDDNTVVLIVEHEHGFEHVPVLMTLKRSGVVFRLRDGRKARDHNTFGSLIDSIKHIMCTHPVDRSQTIINNANGGFGFGGVGDLWSNHDFSVYPKARALYDYETDVLGDLALKAGDIITVIDREDEEGWWNGIIGNRQGLFPSTYVELIEDKPIPAKVDEPREGDTLVALFEYESGGAEELTFHRNDRIVLVDKDDSGWWLGRLEKTGVVGWFAPDLTTRLVEASQNGHRSAPSTESAMSVTSSSSTSSGMAAMQAAIAHQAVTQQAAPQSTGGLPKVAQGPGGGLPRFQSETNVMAHEQNSQPAHDRAQSMRVAPPSGGRGRNRPKAPGRSAGKAVPPPRASSGGIRAAPPSQTKVGGSSPPGRSGGGSPTASAPRRSGAAPAVSAPPSMAGGPSGDSGAGPSPGETYTYAELKNKTVSGLNRARLEEYLSDADFVDVFGMSRDEFSQIPVWKQRMQKKKVGLF